MNNIFEKLEEYARINHVPIMMKESINYITTFIKENNIKTVLEIGTAIGYSSLKMTEAGAFVTTIERDAKMHEEAVKNIKESGKEVKLIYSDALNIDLKIEEKFDLILIDAAKSQNIKFLEKFKKNLNNGGYIIIDNVDFHGLVGKREEIKSRNLRAMIRKIEEFLKYLEEQKEFKVTKINKGDGLILLERNNNE